jgi:hypothetical protein
MGVDRYLGDASRPQVATQASIVYSSEFLLDDERNAARMRSLIHVPWHGDRTQFDLETLDDNDRAVWLRSRFVFDLGAGKAIRLASMVLFFVIDGLDTTWKDPKMLTSTPLFLPSKACRTEVLKPQHC